MDIERLAKEVEGYVIKCRRHLHAYPEESCKEQKTTEFILGELAKMGIAAQRFDDITGCVGTIEGGRGGAVVMLRADIDALPIKEATGLTYASQNEGVMHACGHDCHTAMLLGAAKILNDNKEQIAGTVRLLFQMGEELGVNAGKYVERGALDDVDAVFGMHVWSHVDAGRVNFEYGERMACSDLFKIGIEGKLAHGSAPHQGRDAIVAAAASVMALQTICSRQVDPLDSFVLSVGIMKGGTKENILSDYAELEGTVRTFNRDLRASMPRRIADIVENVAHGYGCIAKCEYRNGPAPLINDDEQLVRIARGAAAKVMGEEALTPLTKMMGAEDFSALLEAAPGVYGYLGVRNEAKGIVCSHHSPTFDVDEDVLYHGAGIYAQFAFDYLREKAQASAE